MGCAPSQRLYHQQSFVFGTLVEISIYGESEVTAQKAMSRVLQEFDRLHHALHAWQPSALSRVNEHFAQSQLPIEISPELALLIQFSKHFETQSNGLFNPAIGQLIRVWGFQNDTFQSKIPVTEEIQYWQKQHPSMRSIQLIETEGHFFAKTTNPAVRLDFGGVAKGYALDLAAQILKRLQIENALINIGGNILALGSHGDRPWRVGIQHPRRSGVIGTLPLYDGEAIGTSGDYQRYFMVGTKRYCHLLDPRTGLPAQTMQSVTVLIPKQKNAGILSDAMTKPLFIEGMAHWLTRTSDLHLQNVLVIGPSGNIVMTAPMKKRLTLE